MTLAESKYKKFYQKLFAMSDNLIFENFIEKKKHLNI